MKRADVDKLVPGLYLVRWKEGGRSQAAIGIGSDGRHWLAPINWVAPSFDHWRLVASVERLLLHFHPDSPKEVAKQ